MVGLVMVLGKFQCPGTLLIWTMIGQGPTVLAAGASGNCLNYFSLIYHFSFLSHGLINSEILSQRAVKPESINQSIIMTEFFYLDLRTCPFYI